MLNQVVQLSLSISVYKMLDIYVSEKLEQV